MHDNHVLTVFLMYDAVTQCNHLAYDDIVQYVLVCSDSDNGNISHLTLIHLCAGASTTRRPICSR